MNISIAIADLNLEYIERLSEVLQQYEELTIHIYTSGYKLQAAIEKNRFDVVLFDPDISEERLVFPGVKLPICLYSDEAHNRSMYADFAKVVKYQRVSNIYKEIIREYADKAGYSADFDNSKNTGILAVYSPVGGSGKTTIALTVASKLVSQGKAVLFISAEQLNSSLCLNAKREDGVTALVEAVADERVNFELKVKGIMKSGVNGMYYLEGFDRIVDYSAVTGDEFAEVLNRIRRGGFCNVVVVDMESNLDSISRSVIETADKVLVVEKAGELPAVKMNLFAQQTFTHEHRDKMMIVHNFAENNSVYSDQLAVPVVGTVHNYGNLQLKNVIQAINANGEIILDAVL